MNKAGGTIVTPTRTAPTDTGSQKQEKPAPQKLVEEEVPPRTIHSSTHREAKKIEEVPIIKKGSKQMTQVLRVNSAPRVMDKHETTLETGVEKEAIAISTESHRQKHAKTC